MKNYNSIMGVVVGVFSLSLASCDYDVAISTTVQPNGQLEKSIAYQSRDSLVGKQYFISTSNLPSWKIGIERDSSTDQEKKRYWIRMQKSFESAEAANDELASPNDSLFRIHSHFEKRFRWFYTYIDYQEVYKAINRFQYDHKRYFTPEELTFIDRLPAEGSSISHADSLFLDQLSSKILDQYAFVAYAEGVYEAYSKALSRPGMNPEWLTMIYENKEELLNKKDISPEKGFDFNDPFAHFLDSIGAQLPDSIQQRIDNQLLIHNNLVEFMSAAQSGIYVHTIHMPWAIVDSNADSIMGNTLIWKPSTLKFMFKEHTFYAQSRKLNYEIVALTVAIIILGLYLTNRRVKAKSKLK